MAAPFDTLFVSTVNGNDLNDGSSVSNALKTITKAIEKAYPGHTIIVASGTYNEELIPLRNGKSDSLITFLADTAGIYFTGYYGQVIINGNDTSNYGFNLTDRSYIAIKGFTFQNHFLQPIYINSQNSNVSGITIENCKFNNWAINTMTDSSAILINSNTGYSIKNINILGNLFDNTIYSRGSKTIALKGIDNRNIDITNNIFLMNSNNNVCLFIYGYNNNINISKNKFYNAEKAVFYDLVADSIFIINNYIFSYNGYGVYSNVSSSNCVKIIYNTINTYNNNCIKFNYSAENVVLVNNILNSEYNLPLYIATGLLTGCDYNLYKSSSTDIIYYGGYPYSLYDFKNTDHVVGASNGDENSIQGDPLFVQTNSFILQNNSPAIDSATLIDITNYGINVNKDITGKPRDKNTPTIGCYESYGHFHGNYTIGIPDGDFQTISQAISAISMPTIIDGPVTFVIKKGIFVEEIYLEGYNFSGISSDNTLTFIGEDSIYNTIIEPIIEHPFIFNISGLSYVSFKNITFSLPYSEVNAININSNCSFITIENCRFVGVESYNNKYISSEEVVDVNNILIKNNYFENASNALNFSNLYMNVYNINIENNTFKYQSSGSISISSSNIVSNINITKNTIGPSNGSDAIYIEKASNVSVADNYISNIQGIGINFKHVGTSKIVGNKITDVIGTFNAYGITWNFDTISNALIANNSISHIAAPTYVMGLYIEPLSPNYLAAGALKILNNTISLNRDNINGLSNNGEAYGIYLNDSNGYINTAFQILNNISSVKLGETQGGANNTKAYAIFAYNKNIISESNYNLFEADSCDENGVAKTYDYTYSSLNNWQLEGFDINSIAADPQFISPIDLRLKYNSQCIDAGKPGFTLNEFGITTDVLGNARIENDTIDIGAYEFKQLQVETNGPTFICLNDVAVFTVTPNMPSTYQWQSSTDSTTWNDMPGKTWDSIHVSPSSDMFYRCIVSEIGQDSIYACFNKLNVYTPVSITTQPTAQTVCTGADATFSIVATGTGISYQWQVSADNGNTWNSISGQTSTSLNLNSVTIGMNANQYRCVVSGTCGSVTSNSALLTVNNNISISSQPTEQNVCEGGNANFSVTANGSAITYQWQESNDGGINWKNIDGAESNILSINSSLEMNGNIYRCQINSFCGNINSNSAILYVNNCQQNITDKQKIYLKKGWNIISLNITPNNTDLLSIFNSIIQSDNLIKVQDEQGKAIEKIDNYWINAIGQYQSTEGYYIKVKNDDTLSIDGYIMIEKVPLYLSSGWNIISYQLKDSIDAEKILSNIIANGNLVKAMDESGLSIENINPLGFVNNIKKFVPGDGYKVKVKAPSYIYYSNIYKSLFIIDSPLVDAHFELAYKGNGYNHMSVYITKAYINNKKIEKDDEIGIFDGDICVGRYIYNGTDTIIAIPVSKDDPTTPEKDGFNNNNRIIVKVWDASEKSEITHVYVKVKEGYNMDFVEFGTTILEIEASTTNIYNYNSEISCISKIFPNPASDEVNININIVKEEKVIIAIYDILGNKIKQLTDNILTPGLYSVNWKCTNEKEQLVIPGVYICRMETGNMVFTRQIIIR
jgi:hypothetical protein